MHNYINGHYYSLNQYLRETFGCKVYKIALSGGYTCPNRDGTLDTRGCIFCSKGGSGEFAAPIGLPVSRQIDSAIMRVSSKIKEGKFIAYFQTFTATYMPADRLEKLLYDAVSDERIAAVSVATRPDCLPDDVLDILTKFNLIKPVWVELGLQTIHPETVKYIRRGYTLDVYDQAVNELRLRGINTIAHVILGLHGESLTDMISTARYAGVTADGVKLQLLHVLKNTDLAKEYDSGNFSVMSCDEYIDAVCRCLEVIPPDTVIHRLTGDGDKRLLIAPLWSGDKKRVLNAMNKELDARNIIQGSKV